MNPSVFHFAKEASTFKLYIGEYTTIDGLKAIDGKTAVKVKSAGASDFKGHVYANAKDFPELNTASETITFLEKEDVELFDFEIELIGTGTLSTHDDGECHFVFNTMGKALEVLSVVLVKHQLEHLYMKLVSNSLFYGLNTATNNWDTFTSFDAYLEKLKGP